MSPQDIFMLFADFFTMPPAFDCAKGLKANQRKDSPIVYYKRYKPETVKLRVLFPNALLHMTISLDLLLSFSLNLNNHVLKSNFFAVIYCCR